ncbi:MAG: hypothetical protein K6E62_00870 [Lachnospiraceae bacterium]|nr:hypothetical protein [Lachnospiraceae bacterium]
MNKPLLIFLMVLCVLTIAVTIYFLVVKITRRIGRLPVKGLISLLVLFIGLLILLFWLLTKERNGSSNGGDPVDAQYASQEDMPPAENEQDHIYLKNDVVWIDSQKVDADRLEEKIDEYLKPRINNAVRVTIVDDYSSSELVKRVEAIFRKNNLEKDKGYLIEVKK